MNMDRKQCELAKNFIEKNSLPVPESGCWIWEGREDHGQVRFLGENELLSPLAFEAYKGPIPHGLTVTHQCHVESCVNPVHLSLSNISINHNK